MEQLNIKEVENFVNSNIVKFHQSKLNRLKDVKLKDILKKKNPYLFKAKDINIASDLVKNILEAYLSSSEEKFFGDFLEELAIFIVSKTCKGYKSSTQGIDLEFSVNNIRYLVSVKSGPNWGNSSQIKKQQEDFDTAVTVLKHSKSTLQIQPVLGICYGKTRTRHLRGYLKVVGQNFWYLISKNENLYIDIIEPLGYHAKKHNSQFEKEKAKLINSFTSEFINDFCDDGKIDWKKLVKFNSGNFNEKNKPI